MRAIVDTHVFLWFGFDDPRLSPRAREVISAGRNDIVLSAVVAWEITIKHAIGRLPAIKEPPATYIERRIREEALTELPVDWRHATRIADLPPLHRDPFDRLLVAQSLVEGMPVITSDAELARYGIEVIW